MKNLLYKSELFLIRHRELSVSIINSTFVLLATLLGYGFSEYQSSFRVKAENAKIIYSETPDLFASLERCPRSLEKEVDLYGTELERLREHTSSYFNISKSNDARDLLKESIRDCMAKLHKLSLVFMATGRHSFAKTISEDIEQLVKFQATVDGKVGSPWEDSLPPLIFFDRALGKFSPEMKSHLREIRSDLIISNL